MPAATCISSLHEKSQSCAKNEPADCVAQPLPPHVSMNFSPQEHREQDMDEVELLMPPTVEQ
jgi:hypothetical protein